MRFSKRFVAVVGTAAALAWPASTAAASPANGPAATPPGQVTVMESGWSGPWSYSQCVKHRQVYANWGFTVGPCTAPEGSTVPGPVWYFHWSI
jgi:hypothetical protein